MKIITCFILMIFSLNLVCQISEVTPETPPDIIAEDNDHKKFLIGINYSVDFNYRTLSETSTNDEYQQLINNSIIPIRDSLESYKISYSVGFDLNYFFNRKLGINLGFQFSNKGFQYNYGTLTFGNIIDPRNGGFAITPTPTDVKIVENYYYVDLPLSAIFRLGRGKFRFISTVGVATNIFINHNSTSWTNYSDGSTEKRTSPSYYSEINKLNFSATVSIGSEMKIKNRSFIRIEPTFRYGLLTISDTPITAKLWNAGINFSYYFGIK